MDTRNAVMNFDPRATHDDAVALEGLEDLFHWASEMVATEAGDPRSKRANEQKFRRNVLGMIQHTKEIEARDKFANEVCYLQRRVIALLQAISEKQEENSSLKQIIVTQYFAMARLHGLEEELKQLQSMTWYRDEAEAERKELLKGLTKLKSERDFLDDLVTAAENENIRLAKLYNEAKTELTQLKSRRWWRPLATLFKRIAEFPATA